MPPLLRRYTTRSKTDPFLDSHQYTYIVALNRLMPHLYAL